MYSSLLIDGDASEVLDDILEMEIDLLFFVDIKTTGINLIKEKIKNKICIKATIDMKQTLGVRKPLDILKEAHELVKSFHTKRGVLYVRCYVGIDRNILMRTC